MNKQSTEGGLPLTLTIEVQRDAGDDTAVVILSGDVDIATAPTLRASVRQLLDDGVQQLVFTSTDVAFMDSHGLGVLLALVREGATVVVRKPSSAVRRLLEVSGADSLLGVEEG